MPALVCLCLLILAAPAAAGTAVCEVDLEAGSFGWTAPDGRQLDPLNLPDAALLFEELAGALAAGDRSDSLRARIGRAVVSPVWSEISGADAWRITPPQGYALPGLLGVFGALACPDGRAVIEHVPVCLAWPSLAESPDANAWDGSGAILMSAPFARNVDPATDDPDTLRHALAKAVRSVRLIPRNETDMRTLQEALLNVRPGLWWFRGESRALEAYVGWAYAVRGAMPPVLVWTLPSRSSQAAPVLGPDTMTSSPGAPLPCLVVATRAVSETLLAPLARDFVDGLARGLDCGTALHEAQLATLDSGLHIATSLVVVGDPTVTADLDRASWLKRLFR